MNIDTAPGEKVTYVANNGFGTKVTRAFGDAHLTRGAVYTVATVVIENYDSFNFPKATVYLAEFPRLDEGGMDAESFAFDASLFENVCEGEFLTYCVCRKWRLNFEENRKRKGNMIYDSAFLMRGIK